MVATMKVYFNYGGSDTAPTTPADVTDAAPPSEPPTMRFKSADDATVDGNNKLAVPTTPSTLYSYWKHVFLFCSAADSHTMNNVKLYTDGSNSLGTGVDVVVGLQFPTKNSGSSAGYKKATSNVTMVTNHPSISSVATIFNYSTGSRLSLSISESGSVIDAANETSNYVVTQMTVTDAASPGDLTNEVGIFAYDEA